MLGLQPYASEEKDNDNDKTDVYRWCLGSAKQRLTQLKIEYEKQGII